MIAFGSAKDIHLLDISCGDIKKFKGHSDLVTSVAFSPNGMHIASASDDRTIKLWEVDSGTVSYTHLTLPTILRV